MKIRFAKIICKCGKQFKIEPDINAKPQACRNFGENKSFDSLVKCPKCGNFLSLHFIKWVFQDSFLLSIKTFCIKNGSIENNKDYFLDVLKDLKLYLICKCNKKLILSVKKAIKTKCKAETWTDTRHIGADSLCNCGRCYGQNFMLISNNNFVYGFDIELKKGKR